MRPAILVLNAGSSSLKFALYADDTAGLDLVCEGAFSGIGDAVTFDARDASGGDLPDAPVAGAGHDDALKALLDWLGARFGEMRLIGAAHRVVHGGSRYSAPVIVDAGVVAELTRLIPLAPLHQPHHLAAIAAVGRLHPDLPQVACFDTAFHHGQSRCVTDYALPRALTAEGVRRYGFHGLSYEYIAGRLPDVVGAQAEGRVIVAHLGSGASLCGLRARASVATTMGFTALDGLVMSRRCGALDPGVVLYLLQEKGMTAAQVSMLLYDGCGLWGLSGISDDMRELLASDDPNAAHAVEVFVYRIGREIGSLAAALGGLDALVFTAGVGEHAAAIRARVCRDAAWLGVGLDAAANTAGAARISPAGARVSAWVIATDEDLMIARHARRLLHP